MGMTTTTMMIRRIVMPNVRISNNSRDENNNKKYLKPSRPMRMSGLEKEHPQHLPLRPPIIMMSGVPRMRQKCHLSHEIMKKQPTNSVILAYSRLVKNSYSSLVALDLLFKQ